MGSTIFEIENYLHNEGLSEGAEVIFENRIQNEIYSKKLRFKGILGTKIKSQKLKLAL